MNDETRIFVVDDEAKILDAIGRMLEGDGWAVRLFESPFEALEACDDDPPAFIITDFVMAEMSGEELAAKLRIDFGSRCPKIVCVTGWLSELRPEQIRAFDRVLEKPFAYCDLVRVLDDLEREGETRVSGVRLRFPWLEEGTG